MKNAKLFLEKITEKILPGPNQHHNLVVVDGTLNLCLMLDDIYQTFIFKNNELENSVEKNVEEIVKLMDILKETKNEL